MIKHCEVVVRDDAIFVFGNTETQPGVYLTGQPVTKLSRDVPPDDLGKTILSTLDAFQSGAKHPEGDQWKKFEQESLRGTGFGSWRKLSKGARRVGVKREGDSIKVTPTAADRRGGYSDLMDKALHVSSDPIEIGRAIQDALQQCYEKWRLP
jgi:hypothetical protein